MNKQKFQIGEDVIAVDHFGRSVFRSTVIECLGLSQRVRDGAIEHAYRLSPDEFALTIQPDEAGFNCAWGESELRKVDPGSGMTANELMARLKVKGKVRKIN